MGQELRAEQERMAQAWSQAKAEWEALQEEHHELRSQLGQRGIEMERITQRVAAEMGDAVNQLQAERHLISQERGLCRDERGALSRAVLEHRGDVSKQRDRMFSSMESLASEKEKLLHASTLEGAKLDQQKRSAELLHRNSVLERAVAAKERTALSGLMASLQQDKQAFEGESERLRETAHAVESRARQVRCWALDAIFYIHTHTHICVYTHTHTSIYIFTYMYMYTYIYTYMFTHIYIHTHISAPQSSEFAR